MGCEFRKPLRNNPDLKNRPSSHTYVKNSPINIRDALYVGRTEAAQTYFGVKREEEILYVDIISVYPYICNNG